MKNKKTLYILIPLVALIWGVIVWQTFSFRSEEDTGNYVYHASSDSLESDTTRYVLTIPYQDPFLRSARTAVKPVSQKKENNIKKVKLNNVSAISKPTGLVYYGMIACNEEKVGLLEYGGRKVLIKENSKVGDYQVVKVEHDSLRIRHQERLYAYGKQ